MNKKVTIFGVFADPNLGDRLLCLSVGKIVQNLCDAEIEYVDFYARADLSPKYPRKRCENTIGSVNWSFFYENFHKIFSLMSLGNYPVRELGCHLEYITDPNRKKRLEKYYEDKIKDSELVIVPGGGVLEDSLEHDFYHNLLSMAKVCEKHNVPLCFNAVGIVHDKRSGIGKRILKKALSSDSVKYISCRDGADVVRLMAKCPVTSAACAATMAGELFEIKKDSDSNTIGIGVIRGNIFTSYANSITEEELIDFYVDLVRTIENKGYDVKLFCNGFIKDYELGEKVVKKLGKNILLKRAQTPEELLGQIASFKAICAARLHAVIGAYSLDVPSVVFSWGTKQKEFMTAAGCPERAVAKENLNAEYVATLLEDALKTGWNEDVRTSYVQTAIDSIRKILAIGGLL